MSQIPLNFSQQGDRTIPARPRLSLADLAVWLWRAKWLMALVFLPIAALGILAALQMKDTYTASSRLMATLDDFYVYRPLSGSETAAVPLEQEQIIQAEMELLRSPLIRERVLMSVGLDTLYPEIAEARDKALAAGRDPVEAIREDAHEAALQAMGEAFGVGAGPLTPIIATSFEHEDPQLAASTLNQLIAAYLDYRTALFTGDSNQTFSSLRSELELELAAVQDERAGFMAQHGLTDLDAERESLLRLTEAVRADLLRVRAESRAVAGQLASVESELASTPPESDIYVEDSSAQALTELEIEREDLLSRYTPESAPVRAIDARIAQLRSFLGQQEQLSGTVRRGPNPLYQSLEANRAELRGQTRSLSAQADELSRQLGELEARQRLLTSLRPQWEDFERRLTLAEANLVNTTARASQEQARTRLAGSDVDNIRVLEPARVPTEGSSLKLPVAGASILFAGFSALMAGLGYAVTRQRFATPSSLSRTLGLPVLSATGRKPPQGAVQRALAGLSEALLREAPSAGGRSVMLLSTGRDGHGLSSGIDLAVASALHSDGAVWLLDLDFRGNPAFHRFESGEAGMRPGRAFDASLEQAPLYKPVGSRLVATRGGVNPAKLLSLHEIPGLPLMVTRFRTEAVAEGQKLMLSRSPGWWTAARSRTDWIFVTAAPPSEVGASLAFCRDVDGVVLVADGHSATLDEVSALSDEVRAQGGQVLGIMLVNVPGDARLAEHVTA